MRPFIFALFYLILASSLAAQAAVIALAPDAPASDQQAAKVLQFYLGKITGQAVEIKSEVDKTKDSSPVFIGGNPAAIGYGLKPPPVLGEDAYFMHGKNGAFQLGGGGELGAEYAVYSFLELLGCRKYSPRDSFIPTIKNLVLPDFPLTVHEPAFAYRELWYEPASNDAWARWHKLKTRTRKNEEWGLFVHTFEKLCPAKEYFDSHPEYFAFNGAQRSPGQLCLSNDTVLQIVTASLREKIREKPQARYWSVSQNDNYDYCKCPRCTASDKRYGGPAGTLVAFVNKVASAFPDKSISTLAYQYTRQAPVGIRPATNVNICLCSIECNRGKSIEEGCTDFARDVQEWSALTENLMIWDYVVQFRSYISPFPNWHTLQPNLQFFQKHKVQMMFEQGSGSDRSEFSDMRAYLLAKLLWNPNANMDSILTDFGKGYYGAAQPYIWDYIHQLTTNLLNGDKWLGIYATPQMEANSFLCDLCMINYFEIMRQAGLAVQGDFARGDKVVAACLPLVFAEFELDKIRGDVKFEYNEENNEVYLKHRFKEEDLDMFLQYCEKSGFKNMHEMRSPPEEYKKEYLAYLADGRVFHKFMWWQQEGSPFISIRAKDLPSTSYEKGDLLKLIDTKRGEKDYHYNWLGFQGKDIDLTLSTNENWLPDLDYPKATSVSVQFLQDQASWVFFPEKVVVEVSKDGKTFERVHEEALILAPDGAKSVKRITAKFPAQEVRAVRLLAVNAKTCPAWHTCNGNPCWVFVDEVVVE